MTNTHTGVAPLYLITTLFWWSLFPFYKGFAVWEVIILPGRPKVTPWLGISQRSCTACSRVWLLGYLNPLGCCKMLWFWSMVGQIGLFDKITSIHFPGNVSMHPYADSFWVQWAQNPLQKVETAEAKTSFEDKGEGHGKEKTTLQRIVLGWLFTDTLTAAR